VTSFDSILMYREVNNYADAETQETPARQLRFLYTSHARGGSLPADIVVGRCEHAWYVVA